MNCSITSPCCFLFIVIIYYCTQLKNHSWNVYIVQANNYFRLLHYCFERLCMTDNSSYGIGLIYNIFLWLVFIDFRCINYIFLCKYISCHQLASSINLNYNIVVFRLYIPIYLQAYLFTSSQLMSKWIF